MLKKTIIFLFFLELSLLSLYFWDPYIVKKKTHFEPLKIDFFIDTSFSQKNTVDRVKKQLIGMESDSIQPQYFAFDGKVRPMNLTDLHPDNYTSVYSLANPLNRRLKKNRDFAVIISDFNFFDENFLSNQNVFLLRNQKKLLHHGLEVNIPNTALAFKKNKQFKITVDAYSIFREKVKIKLSVLSPSALGEYDQFSSHTNIFIPKQGTNVNFYLNSPSNQEQYVIAKMILDKRELAQDVHIISPIKKNIEVFLLSFHPSFMVKAIKLFFEKHSGYNITSKEFYSPKHKNNVLEFKKIMNNIPHQSLILIDPPLDIQKIIIKTQIPFLWISTLSFDKSSAFLSEDLDFSYTFVNFKGNEKVSSRFWSTMKLKMNLVSPPPNAKIFHKWQGKSAWFETKQYHYLGLTPLVQDRGDIIKFYQILHPLLQSFYRQYDLQLPISSGKVNNFISTPITALENIKLFKPKKEIHETLTFNRQNSKVSSYRSGEKIDEKLGGFSQFFKLKKKNDKEQIIALKVPAKELFNRHHPTEIASFFEDDFSSLKKILNDKLNDLPPQIVSKKIPLIPHPLLFFLITSNFFIIMILKKRMNK